MQNKSLTAIIVFTCLTTCITACSPSDNDSANNSEAAKQTVAATTPAKAESNNTTLNSDFPYVFDKVSENTWIMHGPRELPNPKNKGFMNNPGVVLTSAGLVVVDPGSTVHVGEHVLTEIKKISNEPVVAVFNTHVHGDHWLGNQAIKAAYPNVKIYGHEEMIVEVENGEGASWVATMETLTEGASKGTIVVAPDNAVNNADMIKVGDTEFKIHHYGIAHTKTDIMIEVIGESVVFLGDNVLALRIPRTADGTFQGNIDSVNTVLEVNAKTYVPGHGPTGDKAMVEKYIGYLTLVYEAAQKAFEEDLDSSDVLAITTDTTADYKDWHGYSELLGPQGAQEYGEVEASEF